MGIRLLHTADLHLDRPFPGLGARRAARRVEMRDRFDEICGLAQARGVQALLIAGDLFDRPAAESGPYVKGRLAELAARGIRVFLIPGNHDEADTCRFYHGGFPAGVRAFTGPAFAAADDLPGVIIYGLAYNSAVRLESPLAGLPGGEGRRFRVALVHGQLRSSESIGEDYAPFTSAEIAASGLDYLALGHCHACRDCSAGRTRAWYPGSPLRLDFGDVADRHLLLVELGDDGRVSVEPIAVPDRRFLQIDADAGRPEEIYERLMRAADPEVCLRVRLYGRTDGPKEGLVADLIEKFADRCYGFEVVAKDAWTDRREDRPGTVAHAFSRIMAERLAAAADEDRAELVRMAADYGLLALEGRPLP